MTRFWIGLRLKLVFSQRFRILRKNELQVHLLLASKNKEEGERNLVSSIFAANFICPNRSCLDFSFAPISKETVQSNFHFYGKHQDIFSITDALTQPYKKQIGVDQLISSYPLSMSVCLVILRRLELSWMSHRVIRFWFLLNFLFILAFFDTLVCYQFPAFFQATFQADENPPG